jgi:integrase
MVKTREMGRHRVNGPPPAQEVLAPMRTHRRSRHPGIVVRHQGKCSIARGGERCTCRPTYQASVWIARDAKRVKRHFAKVAEAKAWRSDAQRAIRRGEMKAPKRITLDAFAEEWLAGIKDGTIRSRSRRPYKPSTVRGYERSLRQRVLPRLGHLRIADVRQHDVQDLADRLLADGLSPSAVANQLDPLRSIFRRARQRGLVVVNPTTLLDLEAPQRRRKVRIVSPAEGRRMLEALPPGERALWATALYGGLRRGELRALRWSDVDLGRSEIRVERSWDQEEGPIDPKSETSTRTVPLLAILRDYLDQCKLATGRDEDELVFGRTSSEAFVPSTVRSRAIAAWTEAGIEPIKLHDCRHSFASTLIESGIANAKAIQEAMGHASITMTYDLYGHMLPGSRDEVRERADAYLERQLAERQTVSP